MRVGFVLAGEEERSPTSCTESEGGGGLREISLSGFTNVMNQGYALMFFQQVPQRRPCNYAEAALVFLCFLVMYDVS